MPQKPTIFVTRRLPDDVTFRLSKDYQARLNEHDGVLSADQLVKGAEGADALLVTPTDKLTAEVIGRLRGGPNMTPSLRWNSYDSPSALASGTSSARSGTNTPPASPAVWL